MPVAPEEGRTRPRTCAEVSPPDEPLNSRAGSAATATVKSIRSRSGPEMRDPYRAICIGEQRQGRDTSPWYPHGQGFIAPISMNRAGNDTVRKARAIRTQPSSSG